MCFAKSTPKVVVEPKKVVRHEANGELTKNSDRRDLRRQAYQENMNSSQYGFDNELNKEKKTLLGE